MIIIIIIISENNNVKRGKESCCCVKNDSGGTFRSCLFRMLVYSGPEWLEPILFCVPPAVSVLIGI